MVIVVLDNPLYYLQSARKESEGKSAARLFAHTHLSTFFKLAVFFILYTSNLCLDLLFSRTQYYFAKYGRFAASVSRRASLGRPLNITLPSSPCLIFLLRYQQIRIRLMDSQSPLAVLPGCVVDLVLTAQAKAYLSPCLQKRTLGTLRKLQL